MRKILLAMVALAALIYAGMEMPAMKKDMKMHNFRAVPLEKAQILQDGKTKIFCSRCGMTLPMFYKTNHAAKVDGKMQQFCSIYCLVETMDMGKKVSDIQVVDNTTLKFIPVSKAWYVVGSSKPATMAKKVSKYAFGTKEAAEQFAKKFGGKVMKFDEALALAKKSFESDKEAKQMRQSKMIHMGEMIYNKKCKKTDKKFNSPADAKAFIKTSNICGAIKGKPLQAVGLYLYNH